MSLVSPIDCCTAQPATGAPCSRDGARQQMWVVSFFQPNDAAEHKLVAAVFCYSGITYLQNTLQWTIYVDVHLLNMPSVL